ncbi:MAG: hypothetical protein ACLPLZ_04265 [Terracidiphilus sp.]
MIKKVTSMMAFLWLGIAQIVLLLAWVNFGGKFSAYPAIRVFATREYYAYFVVAAIWVFIAQLMRKREVAMEPIEILAWFFTLFIVVAVPLIQWSKGLSQTLPSLPPFAMMAAMATGALLSELRRKTQEQKAELGKGNAA